MPRSAAPSRGARRGPSGNARGSSPLCAGAPAGPSRTWASHPVLTGEGGAPAWPDGVVGSMTHCDGYRAAAVANAGEVRGVGIDAAHHLPFPRGCSRPWPCPPNSGGTRNCAAWRPASTSQVTAGCLRAAADRQWPVQAPPRPERGGHHLRQITDPHVNEQVQETCFNQNPALVVLVLAAVPAGYRSTRAVSPPQQAPAAEPGRPPPASAGERQPQGSSRSRCSRPRAGRALAYGPERRPGPQEG